VTFRALTKPDVECCVFQTKQQGEFAVGEELLLAAEYRKHAKALRAAARFDRDAKTSLVLKRIAGEYEITASSLEGIDGANKSLKDRPDT
jgi:hypothetical protein